MPAAVPPTPTRIEEEHKRERLSDRGPGFGGRPPLSPKHTGGGGEGDGDNWDDRAQGSRGPQERLRRARPSLIFFLIGDAMVFAALVAAFFVTKGQYHFERSVLVESWRAVPVPPILWLNTIVMLLSSVAVEIGRRHIFREVDVMDEWLGLGRPAARRAGPWIVLTLFLGFVFLAGQWMAYLQLKISRGYLALYRSASQSSDFFKLFTGFHAAHLAVGLIALAACVVALIGNTRLETRQVWVDTTAWYWHCMGIFWVVLFVILECFQ